MWNVTVKHDSLSKMLTLLAAVFTVYLSTFQLDTWVIMYPVILLTTGVVMQQLTLGGLSETDSIHTAATQKQILFYTAVSTLALTLASFAVRVLVPASLDVAAGAMFVCLMAVAETVFFQGFILNFLLARFPSSVAIVACSVVSGALHLARYGSDLSSLSYVMAGFVVLNWAAWKSGRMSVPMLAHLLNNLMSVM